MLSNIGIHSSELSKPDILNTKYQTYNIKKSSKLHLFKDCLSTYDNIYSALFKKPRKIILDFHNLFTYDFSKDLNSLCKECYDLWFISIFTPTELQLYAELALSSKDSIRIHQELDTLQKDIKDGNFNLTLPHLCNIYKRTSTQVRKLNDLRKTYNNTFLQAINQEVTTCENLNNKVISSIHLYKSKFELYQISNYILKHNFNNADGFLKDEEIKYLMNNSLREPLITLQDNWLDNIYLASSIREENYFITAAKLSPSLHVDTYLRSIIVRLFIHFEELFTLVSKFEEVYLFIDEKSSQAVDRDYFYPLLTHLYSSYRAHQPQKVLILLPRYYESWAAALPITSQEIKELQNINLPTHQRKVKKYIHFHPKDISLSVARDILNLWEPSTDNLHSQIQEVFNIYALI